MAPDQSATSLAAGGTVANLIQDLLQGSSQGTTGETSHSPSQWYLGIDVGTTGISAVLLDRVSGQLYPVYWEEAQVAGSDRRFRLPAVISLIASDEAQNLPQTQAGDRRGIVTLTIAQYATPQSAADRSPVRLLQGCKPFLKLGIPYLSPQIQQWQPVVQWSDAAQVPLIWMQQALQALLATLKPAVPSSTSSLTCGAIGLEADAFSSAIDQLAAVIVGYPFNWTDTYSFNLREVILGARLVDRPEQIFLIEDTIAALLSVLPQVSVLPQEADYSSLPSPIPPPTQRDVVLQNADWQGNTLILNAGATLTELALVNLPDQLQDLQYADFHIHSLPFAGDAIDQDIVCHLLYPLLQRSNAAPATLPDRVDLSLGAVQLAELQLERLVLPGVGELDLPHRHRLRQRLEQRQSGRILLDAAHCLKVAFQQQSRCTLQLGDRYVTILRQDLGSRILLPYVQRLNRELNNLLHQTATPPELVNQVICTGGTASIRAIGRWLHEKFPNASVIQDTYTYPTLSVAHCLPNCVPSCSRIAYGLAALPLHPQVLDITRHQHNDYFLLLRLLQFLPDRPVTLGEILQTLQQQGIELTEQGRSHLVALLEGHLPPGLIPSEQDLLLLAEVSRRNADLRGIRAMPLCQKQGDYYKCDRQQQQQLQRVLATILNQTHQKLDEPYRFDIVRVG